MAKTFDDKKIIYTMDGVSKSHGTKQVLKDICLSYYYGAKIGVLGLNGSGKSSLFYSGNYVPPSAELQPKTRPTDIKYLIGSCIPMGP